MREKGGTTRHKGDTTGELDLYLFSVTIHHN